MAELIVALDVQSREEAVEKVIAEQNMLCEKAKVTAGYDLEVNIRIKGSDDEDDNDIDMTVVKVDGKWVSLSSVNSYSAITGLCYALGM